MDIIGIAGLGREFNALKNSDDPLIQNYEELLEPTVEKLTYFAAQIVFTAIICKPAAVEAERSHESDNW